MADVIIPIGNTIRLSPAGSATPNVANVSTQTTAFHIANAGTNNAYVGIFDNYAAAAAMTYPNVAASAGGVVMTANESMTMAGNFGATAISSTGIVYVAAITSTGNSTNVFITPIAI